MIPRECRRLIEVDFPVAEVSRNSAAEKEARCGHIPKIHIWPAARPTTACRAVLLGLLLPDPCDRHCPPEFKTQACSLLAKIQRKPNGSDDDLQAGLLRFIANFSNWDCSAVPAFLEVGRGLVRAAHNEEIPLVVDPFAGGGAIPLEAMRLGCDAFASDLNPVALLIEKTVLEDIPKAGTQLRDALKETGDMILTEAEKELADLYPREPDGATPITYLWARTVKCEAPNCGTEIPLLKSMWLCKKKKRKFALRPLVKQRKGRGAEIDFEVFQPSSDREVPPGLIIKARAKCLACGTVLAPERLRAQLAQQRGGADTYFDHSGIRIGGARLIAVVSVRKEAGGRHYRVARSSDYIGVYKAQERLNELLLKKETDNSVSPVPDELLPPVGTLGFRVQRYGMLNWRDLFAARQRLALHVFCRLIGERLRNSNLKGLMALVLSKMVDMNNSLATWQPHAEIPAHMLTRFAIPMKWDFAEAVPISDSSGTLESAIKRATEVFPSLAPSSSSGTVQIASACEHPLPDSTAAVWFTDPPYYDAVPYADLSDFFFVWLKRALPAHPLLRDPFDANNRLTPKSREAVQNDKSVDLKGSPKDKLFYENTMAAAFAEGRRVLKDDGIASVVFAHKTTEGWEALVSGIIRGGWTITSSWPIATEMGSRLRARDSAALATSVHLVCRPRRADAGVGDWGDVLRALPKRVGDWIDRLQKEGVHGADLVFACIGPALEIYSQYSKVEDAEGREIPLGGDPESKDPSQRGFLAYVWEIVGRAALEHVLGTAEAKARNGGPGALEEDARLTALFLWTIQGTIPESSTAPAVEASEDEGEEGEDDDTEQESSKKKKAGGYTLIFDVVRRFAQPLGINLLRWEGRIIETEKGVVRLLPVAERAKQLFGKSGLETVAEYLEKENSPQLQLVLFPQNTEPQPIRVRGRKGKSVNNKRGNQLALSAEREPTTLDRVHAAMLLQSQGMTNALRELLKSEKDRGPEFLRLSNALTALYPRNSEEKRLLDAMLLAYPR